jgi:crotonobetainyl-CoA:carnitine CoA-transferase CaiB-like acyl-CoA transferase
MKLGDVAHPERIPNGKPLDGVRVLALEQMQALPYATQLLSRLGADVVKVESPGAGDLGRSGQPFITDAQGTKQGATFVRNNLGKRSIAVDLKNPIGRDLILRLAPKFDVVAENFKAGSLGRMGLGYNDIVAVHPKVVYLSVSGFGNSEPSQYDNWPAFAAIAEAMSGMYEFKRSGDRPPIVSPFGALGDTTSALFAVIGVLAALRHRDARGFGQHVDIAMYDSMISMADIALQYPSMGHADGNALPLIMDGFRAADGWFVMQCARSAQFHKLSTLIGKPEWVSEPLLSSPDQWRASLETVIRPAVEAWSKSRTKLECCHLLANEGIAAGPCSSELDLANDPLVAARNMIIEFARTDGVDQPVLLPGNPVKLSAMAEGPHSPLPVVGEHTNEVLREELSLSQTEIDDLVAAGALEGKDTSS